MNWIQLMRRRCYDSTHGFYPEFDGPEEIEINGVFLRLYALF